MDFNALVDEIVARVSEKLNSYDAEEAAPLSKKSEGKQKLLALASARADECRRFAERAAIAEAFDTECARPGEWNCCSDDYDALVFFDLSVGDMAGIATGVCMTQFAIAARKALLLGKKLFAAHEGMELYSYAETAPSAYYSRLLEHLLALQKSGMVVCPIASLEEAVLKGVAQECEVKCAPQAQATDAKKEETSIYRRVITEKEIAAVYTNSLRTLHVAPKAIVTDLAREYAASRGVVIVKDLPERENKK